MRPPPPDVPLSTVSTVSVSDDFPTSDTWLQRYEKKRVEYEELLERQYDDGAYGFVGVDEELQEVELMMAHEVRAYMEKLSGGELEAFMCKMDEFWWQEECMHKEMVEMDLIRKEQAIDRKVEAYMRRNGPNAREMARHLQRQQYRKSLESKRCLEIERLVLESKRRRLQVRRRPTGRPVNRVVPQGGRMLSAQAREGAKRDKRDETPVKMTAREKREQIQRDKAEERERQQYKSIPKEQRMAAIRAERDKRVPQGGVFVDAIKNNRKLAAGVAISGAALLGIGKIFGSLRKAVKKVTESVSEVAQKIKKAVENIKKLCGGVIWAVPVILVGYFYFRHHPDTAFRNLVCAVLCAVVGKLLWDRVSSHFESVEPQAGTGFANFGKVMASVMAFAVFRGKATPAREGEFMKRISLLDRASDGFESFCEWVVKAIECSMNFVASFFTKKRVSLYKDAHAPVVKWTREVDEAAKRSNLGSDPMGAEELNHIVALAQTGYGFKSIYRGTKMAKIVDEYVIRAQHLLTPYAGALRARNNFRQEPVMLVLTGAPGVGKTLLATPLCGALLKMSGTVPPEADFNAVTEQIWQKGVDEYWNSYCGQACVVMDDAFQMRADSTDKENEFISIIKMIGSWSMPLNFADVESKGKIFFSSKLVFATTNARSVISEARIVLTEPEAVVRRLKYSYSLHVSEEFCTSNGRLDEAKYRKELEKALEENDSLDAFPWHVWYVKKHNFASGETSAVKLHLRDVIAEVAGELRKRSEGFSETRDNLAKFFGKMGSGVKPQSGGVPEEEERARYSLPNYKVKLNVVKWAAMVVKHAQDEATAGEKFLRVVGYMVNWIFLTSVFFLAIKTIGAILKGVVALIKGMAGAVTGRKPKEEKSLQSQSNIPVRIGKPIKVKANDVRAQAGDLNVVNNVYENTYKVVIKPQEEGSMIMGQIIFLEHELAVEPEHFSSQLREKVKEGVFDVKDKVLFRHVTQSEFSFSYTVEKYLALQRVVHANLDTAFVKFSGIRAHRSIVRSFVKEADVRYVNGVRLRLDICESDERRNRAGVHNVMLTPTAEVGKNMAYSGRFLSRYVKYHAATVSGDCGAPLSLFDNTSFSGRTVVGFHVAGRVDKGLGYSTIVTQEFIESARNDFGIVKDLFIEDALEQGIEVQGFSELPFKNSGSFLCIGKVKKPVPLPQGTSYYPTGFYGRLGEYEHLPAPLSAVFRDGQLVRPMENALAPYRTEVLHFEQPWLRHAMHTAVAPLFKVTKECHRDIYTFETAVLGEPRDKMRSLPRGTSAGYPYVLTCRDGKKSFFGSGEQYDLTGEKCQKLKKRVHHIIDCARRGERLCHLSIDLLKDELRSKAKVEAVATRLISAPPVCYSIAWRMMFGAFSSAMMRNPIASGMAPGICTYTDWSSLVEHLSKKGDLVFDGDFKAFDASEQPCILEMILDVVNRWYDDGPDNERIRKVLWLDLMHSRHIGGTGKDQSYVYQWAKSLPSGHPFTTIVNSIYSLFCLVSAYVSLTGDLTGFWTHVSPVTYGDDNVSNVSREASEVFNQVTVAQALKREFSMTYTPGHKDGAWCEVMSLEEITFLKRGFSLRANEWLCPLELESFLYTCYWCKNSKLEKEILVNVLETALEELSMHPYTIWGEFAGEIARLLEELGVGTQAPLDQDSYALVVRSRKDNWY